MTLTPTELHETLDTRGLLDDSMGPGAYGLRVDTPNDVEGVARSFLEVGDATPGDAVMKQLTSKKCAYVGGSTDVYARLEDHARAEVRKATFLEAFDVVDLVDVWPSEEPFREERKQGRKLSRVGWACWVDGGLL